MLSAIAIILTLGVSNFVFASNPAQDPDSNGQYTISVADDDTHSYKVFQVLTGTLVPGENTLGNAAWGADAISNPGTVSDFVTDITAAGLSEADIAAKVTAKTNTSSDGQGTVSKGHSLPVDPGYYVLVDVTTNLAAGDSLSLNVVRVFNNIQITPKKTTVESHKDVKDINDSTDSAASDWQKVADHDQGDVIEYRIYAKLPTDHYDDYKKYPLNFVDTMSKGLTLVDNSTKLYVTSDLSNLGTEKDNAPTPADVSAIDDYKGQLTGAYDGGKVWKWSIVDVKAIGATAGQYVVITYQATLNDNALIGAAGNPNTMYVEYANNPNVDNPTPEGKTTPEANIVFTYRVDVDKIKGEDYSLLQGAGFTLYKQYNTEQSDKGNNAAADLGKTSEYWYAVGSEQYSNGTLNQFSWLRVDDGNYILKETHTPTGYNTVADIPFTITVNHSTTDTSALTTELSVSGEGFQASTTGGTLTFKKTETITHDKTVVSGSVATAVVNEKGTQLPSTGGSGTTMIYIIGVILLAGAGILLVTRRRMKAE